MDIGRRLCLLFVMCAAIRGGNPAPTTITNRDSLWPESTFEDMEYFSGNSVENKGIGGLVDITDLTNIGGFDGVAGEHTGRSYLKNSSPTGTSRDNWREYDDVIGNVADLPEMDSAFNIRPWDSNNNDATLDERSRKTLQKRLIVRPRNRKRFGGCPMSVKLCVKILNEYLAFVPQTGEFPPNAHTTHDNKGAALSIGLDIRTLKAMLDYQRSHQYKLGQLTNIG